MEEFIKYFLGGLFLFVSCSLLTMTSILCVRFMYVFFKDIWNSLNNLY